MNTKEIIEALEDIFTIGGSIATVENGATIEELDECVWEMMDEINILKHKIRILGVVE